MSIQRARINCRRCYSLAKIEVSKEDTEMPGPIRDAVIRERQDKNDSLYNARNEAMKALERAVRPPPNSIRDICGAKEYESAKVALTACESCDFKSPKVINTTGEYMELVKKRV